MAKYVETADITDKILTPSALSPQLTAKIALSDDAVEDMAKSKGVDVASIDDDPVHHLVNEWAIAWVGRQMCFDNIGVNNTEVPEIDKYTIKWTAYKKILQDVEGQISTKVLTGNDDEARDRATHGTVILYHN